MADTATSPMPPMRLGVLPPRRLRDFVSKFVPTGADDCWLWTAAVNRHGYGKFGAPTGRGTVEAHRVAYELFCGDIPPGLEIDHLCRVRNCVNPEHLEAVTKQQNCLRGESVAAQYARRTHCKHGHEYTPENTRIEKNHTRICRACQRRRSAAYKARRSGK